LAFSTTLVSVAARALPLEMLHSNKQSNKQRKAWTVIVSVKRDRKILTSTNTPYEHEFKGDD
jgi:hypothetical protein